MATTWEFRVYDKDQFSQFVRGYYNVDNRIKPLGDDRAIRGYFRGASSEEFTQASMSVSTPMHYVADTAAFMVTSCRSGLMHLKGERGSYALPANASTCHSPGVLLETTTGPGLVCTVTHLHTDRVHRICSALIGSELDDPLKLGDGSFSPLLNDQWVLAARSFDLVHANEDAGGWAFNALEEYAVSLLLHGHSHNYSKYLVRKEAVSMRITAEAHTFIQEHAEHPITPTVIAEFLRCSVSALARGFREHMGISLRECIYAARVARAHSIMTSGTAEDYHDVLRRVGFMDISRFDAVYRRMFDEAPSDTWRRHTSHTPDRSPRLSPEKIERLRAHILASLARSIRIEDLAALVGLGENQFRILFKRAFGMSPSQYIIEERVNWAQWLLINTSKGIATIADETGFASQAHLNAVFRRLLGTTPGELRKGLPKRR